MENRNSAAPPMRRSAKPAGGFSSFEFRISMLTFLVFLIQTGCAAPGDPQPPRPTVPAAVKDLAVRQAGDGAMLTFTPPGTTTEGEKLEGLPDVEILRGFAPAGAKMPPAAALRVVYTIPAAVLDTYIAQDRVEFSDPIPPQEIAQHAGQRLIYVIRTRVSKRQASLDSNVASVVLYPPPERIGEVRATVIEAGVQLAWQAPERTTAGERLTSLSGYRIYRAEAEAGASSAGKAKRKSLPALVGLAPSASYLDAQIEWGSTYVYTVRSVAQYQAESVESGDSQPVIVTPRDIFPPAAPRDLVAVFVPAAGETPASVELSWAINPESDLAGYNVYRTGAGALRERLNKDLLPTPTFRDMSIQAGEQYTYTVTAVDRAGNESGPAAVVAVDIPKNGR